jgi:diguanylate cyclase (GGDEF)-like protein
MNLALCGILNVSGGRVTGVDPTTAGWIGLSPEDIVGRAVDDILPPALLEAVDGRLPEAHGARLVLDPGAQFPRAVKVETVAAEPDGFALACYDVSDLQGEIDLLEHAQQMSVRESERLQLLLEASVAFAAAMTMDELGPLVVEAARRSFRATSASLHVLEDGRYRMLAGENPLLEYWPEQAPPPGARTVQIGHVVEITSPEEADEALPGIGESFRRAGVRATIVAPMLDQDAPIGALACYFKHERHFDEQAEPLARALAQQAAQAFVRIHLGTELRRRVMHDEVTGLPNRRLFEEQIERILPSTDGAVAVVFVDLDRFKSVNDELGHAYGDALLSQVGQRLRGIFRQDDMVARYGGDEFVAVCAGTNEDDACRIAERVREAIAQPFDGLPPNLHITASVGVVLSPDGASRLIERLLRMADHAMYTAKAEGGNRVQFVHE